jgi:hypothetical protein
MKQHNILKRQGLGLHAVIVRTTTYTARLDVMQSALASAWKTVASAIWQFVCADSSRRSRRNPFSKILDCLIILLRASTRRSTSGVGAQPFALTGSLI